MEEHNPNKKFLGSQRVLMYLGKDLIEEWRPFSGEAWKEHLKFVFVCQTRPLVIGVSTDISANRLIEFPNARGRIVNNIRKTESQFNYTVVVEVAIVICAIKYKHICLLYSIPV